MFAWKVHIKVFYSSEDTSLRGNYWRVFGIIEKERLEGANKIIPAGWLEYLLRLAMGFEPL